MNIGMIFIELLRWILSPGFKWVYKYEFSEHKDLSKCYSKRMEEIVQLKTDLTKMHNMYEKYVMLLDQYPINIAMKNKVGDPIIISCHSANVKSNDIIANSLFTTKHILLGGKLSVHELHNCYLLGLLFQAGITDIEKKYMISICDLTSSERRRGYAKALLEFLIKWARQEQMKYIVGEVVPNDRKDQDWLIPFYRSVGFVVHNISDNRAVMIKYLDN